MPFFSSFGRCRQSSSEWKPVVDPKTGRTYYVSELTNEARWERPDADDDTAGVGAAAATAAAGAADGGGGAGADGPPRPGPPALRPGRESSATDRATLRAANGMPVLRKGYIHKKGHKRKNWKTRYFVLTRDCLTYWETGACLKQKGTILLTQQTEVHDARAGHKFACRFDVVAPTFTPGGLRSTSGTNQMVTYHLALDNEDEKEAWMEAINTVINEAKDSARSGSKTQKTS